MKADTSIRAAAEIKSDFLGMSALLTAPVTLGAICQRALFTNLGYLFGRRCRRYNSGYQAVYLIGFIPCLPELQPQG